MITEKDRGQLLRMAGNIACGMVSDGTTDQALIARVSASIAYKTMLEIDRIIAEIKEDVK